jgi:hypothetical protein
MTLFDFYTLDLTHLIIIAVSSVVFYFLLTKLDPEEKYKQSIIFGSGFSGILISILISYYTLEPDNILTSNFFGSSINNE